MGTDLPDPLLTIEHQRTALYLDEQDAALGLQKNEVAFPLKERAVRTSRQPVEAVKDLDATRQLLEERAGDRALAGVGDLVELDLWEQSRHRLAYDLVVRTGSSMHGNQLRTSTTRKYP